MSRLGAAGLIALLVASLILSVLVYRARSPDLALEVTRLPSQFRPPGAEISFFVRVDSDEGKVEIVGRDQVVARTLAPSIALEAGEPVTCVWDGQDDEGAKVEPGRYRLRVTLADEDREMVFPRRIDVEPGSQNGYKLGFGEPCEQEDA